MTRTQIFILIGLGIAILVVFAGAFFLLLRPEPQEPAVPTLALATVPPNPLLMTRAPFCREVVGAALSEGGWSGEATLDPQQASLEIRLNASSAAEGELPAAQIWGAFEAAVAGRTGGCSGYSELLVVVGGYQARVAEKDLLAWESGAIDDGVLTDRVELTR